MMSVDTSRGPSTLCAYPRCTRTVWEDADGSFSAYCGRTHRDAMASSNKRPPGGICKNCAARPVYIENGHPHDFCGIRCAEKYQSAGNQPANDRRSASLALPEECKLAKCRQLAYVDRNGIPGQYCSQTHRAQAVAMGKTESCLLCERLPKVIINGRECDFCSKACRDDAILSAPIILDIPANSKTFNNVVKQFDDKWEHLNKPKRTVNKVWKIYCTKTLNDAFGRYRLQVERERKLPDGNSRRRFHGTIRACTLGDSDDDRDLCNSPKCSLCGIIKTSFNIAQSGSRNNFGRFGRGIYTSATSSKADDYAKNKGGLSQKKAMLMNQVILGNAIKLQEADESLTEPPSGYDSVIGEPGGELNYDEAIVYSNDAIRPLFLIIYK